MEKRLIDANALKKDFNLNFGGVSHAVAAAEIIDRQPTIDPESLWPTRKQVEKVWKGEWINKHSAYDHKIFTCAQCGKQISIQGENLDFCPKCGSAQTDKAVEITRQRLEALKDG